MALPHVKHVFRCTVLKMVCIWRFMLSKVSCHAIFRFAYWEKCAGQHVVHDKPVQSHYECENIKSGQKDLKRVKVRKRERKRKKTRRPCAANAGISPGLWHQGFGKGRAFFPVRVIERGLTTFSLTPPLCACVWQGRLSKDQRWGSTLLSRNQSLEEEFERAKAAVEVSQKLLLKMCITNIASWVMSINGQCL